LACRLHQLQLHATLGATTLFGQNIPERKWDLYIHDFKTGDVLRHIHGEGWALEFRLSSDEASVAISIRPIPPKVDDGLTAIQRALRNSQRQLDEAQKIFTPKDSETYRKLPKSVTGEAPLESQPKTTITGEEPLNLDSPTPQSQPVTPPVVNDPPIVARIFRIATGDFVEEIDQVRMDREFKPLTESQNTSNEVPDASRVTPPVLLPGMKNPVKLSLEVTLAARRAVGRMIDTLFDQDRFSVLAFDTVNDLLPTHNGCLAAGTNRERWKAVEWIGKIDARGGTEMGPALLAAIEQFSKTLESRRRMVVLVTDGQVTGEDHILQQLGNEIGEIEIHTIGIDQSVNAGFLQRLASSFSGNCELVESEDRLDDAMNGIHRLIGDAVLTHCSDPSSRI